VDGCEVSGSFVIRNAGNLDAPASQVRFYLSEDAVYDEGRDTLLKEVTTKTIEGGESQPIRIDHRLGTGQDVRRKYIIVVIDGENRVVESNKENNYVVGTIE
jgi:subtilase family serine protease